MIYSKKTTVAKVLLEKLNKTTGEVYIFVHKNIDGDCIGSSCGLCEAIRNLGYNATVILGEPVLPSMAFLGIDNHVKVVTDKEQLKNLTTDLVIAVDCSVSSRMTEVAGMLFDSSDNKIIIDHHEISDVEGDYKFIVPEASSASELVYYVIQELAKLTGKELRELVTPFGAQVIVSGIVTDTGKFSYTNTNPETLVAASELMTLGGNISKAMFYLIDWKVKEEFLVSAAASSLARFDNNGKIASVVVKESLLKEYNALSEHVGGIVSELRDIDGVEVAFVLRELGDGKIRVNIRSHEPFDCSAFATKYGGGGHKRASGCTIAADDIDKVRDEIVNSAIEFMN